MTRRSIIRVKSSRWYFKAQVVRSPSEAFDGDLDNIYIEPLENADNTDKSAVPQGKP